MITDTKKGGATAQDIAGYAQYMMSAKDHADAVKGERVLLVQSDNMLTGPIPAPSKRKACKAFADAVAEKHMQWIDQARGGKPAPKSLFQSGSISFSEADSAKLTPGQALEITRQAVNEVMPGDRPVLYAVHGDSACLHVHFLASSVDSHGKIWNPRIDYRLWEAAMERLEIENGLERVQQRKAVAKQDPKREIQVKAPSRPELEIAARTGEASPKALALQILETARATAATIPEFFDAVEANDGYEIVPNGTQGKCSGYSLRCPDGVTIKGSDFGKKYGFNGLQKGGIDYEQDRDFEAISSRREREHSRAFRGSNDVGNLESATGITGGRDTPSIPPSFDRNGSDRGPNGSSGAASSGSNTANSAGIAAPRFGLGASSQDRSSPIIERTLGTGGDRGHSVSDHHDRHQSDSPKSQTQPRSPWKRDSQGSPAAATNEAIERQLTSWDRQCRALGFSNDTQIRIMLIDRDPSRCTVSNPAGAGGMLHPDPKGGKVGFQRKSWRQENGEVRWTPGQVRDAIQSGRLAGLNGRGFDVFMRPYEDGHHYLFVDDTTPEVLASAGYHPCLVQESSAGNYQCVLKVPRKNHAQGTEQAKLEKRAANALALSINDRLGDRQAGRIDQVFRVAGFANKKPNRHGEFTKLDWGRCIPGAVCMTAAQELDDMRDAVRLAAVQKQEQEPEDMHKSVPEMEAEEVRAHAEHARFDRKSFHLMAPSAPEDLRDMAREIRRWAKINGRNKVPDWSAVDYLACRELSKRGWSSDRLSNALHACSPALSDRKNGHEADYVARTVSKAVEATRSAPQPTPKPQQPHQTYMGGPGM